MPQGAMKMPERGRDRIGPSHSLPGRGMTLQVMVVGCGTVFDHSYQAAVKKRESRGMARVVAFVDPNLGRTAAIENHFPSARAFATPAEAFAMTIPNLTIIASPPKWHAEHALAAFSAGSHVLCEKPMAASIDDAERMVAAARGAQRVLAVGMTRRMFPCLAEAQALLGSGAIGDHLRFVHREGDVYGWPGRPSFPFRPATAGGGGV